MPHLGWAPELLLLLHVPAGKVRDGKRISDCTVAGITVDKYAQHTNQPAVALKLACVRVDNASLKLSTLECSIPVQVLKYLPIPAP